MSVAVALTHGSPCLPVLCSRSDNSLAEYRHGLFLPHAGLETKTTSPTSTTYTRVLTAFGECAGPPLTRRGASCALSESEERAWESSWWRTCVVCSGDEHGCESLPGHCPLQLRAHTGLSSLKCPPRGLLTARSSCPTGVRNGDRAGSEWRKRLHEAHVSQHPQRLPAHPLHSEWSPGGWALPLGIRWSGSPA